MNITISGGTGFIGKYVVEKLHLNHEITVLTRNVNSVCVEDKVKGTFLDLSTPDDVLKEQLKKTDVFIHLAAKRPEKKVSDKSFDSYFDYLHFSIRMLDLLKGSACKQIINISTKGVYGLKNSVPFSEEQIPYPTSLYGLSKLFTEQMIDQFVNSNNMLACHLRLGQVIGWGDTNTNLISVFLKNAIAQQKQQIWGEGVGARTYVYVKDVVSAIETVLMHNVEGAYNIGWPKAISHAEMAETINKVFNNTQLEFLRDKPEDKSIEEISTEKATERLGWKPNFCCLEDALYDMKNDYEEKNC